ncbi:MAG: hypothetical protein NT157_00590 [Candidatus Micrarchaeota archaeon]|nr:hypothetical protein [Candidatus Micrarchaeota archaeon]
MMNNDIDDIDNVGKTIALYYRNPEKLEQTLHLDTGGGKPESPEIIEEKEKPEVAKSPGEDEGKEEEEAGGEGESDEKRKKDKTKKGDEWKAQLDRLSSLIKKDKKKK